MSKKMLAYRNLALRLLVGISLTVFVLSRTNFSLDGIAWERGLLVAMPIATVLMLCTLALSATRWRLVLGPGAPPLRTLWRYYLIGWACSLFLPTSVGGDAVRAVAVTRDSARPGEALSSIVFERLLGVSALLTLLALGMVIDRETVTAALGLMDLSTSGWGLAVVLAALAFAALVFIGLRTPYVADFLRDAIGLIDRFRRSPARMAGAVVVSLGVQTTYVIVWAVLAWGFRITIPFATLLVFVPLISVAAMLPITISGLGVRESAWALLLAPLGVPPASAVAFSLLYYLCGLLLGVVGGVLYVTSGVRPPTAPAAESTSYAAGATSAVAN